MAYRVKTYTLREEAAENGTRYFISFKDGQGGYHELEVSEQFFTEFRQMERSELLHRIIAALPEIQRRRFLLYYEYDFNYYDIAAMEHCTAQAVRRSVVLAREKIKVQMKKYLCP